MRLNAKRRLLSAARKTVSADVAFDFFQDENEEYLRRYDIDTNSLFAFVKENDILNLVAATCIKEMHGLTGMLGYDFDNYLSYKGQKNDYIVFLSTVLDRSDKSIYKTLGQQYLDLVKSKYRKYIYPIADTYYYDQIFPEFEGFDLDEDIKTNKYGDYRDFDDYVKSTGFR